jgi:hypothetical protein
MLAGFRRLSIGIMWYVEVLVRGLFIQGSMLRDVVLAGVGCVLPNIFHMSSSLSPLFHTNILAFAVA